MSQAEAVSAIDDETPLAEIDVSDPALYQQDVWQDVFRRLRREAPVHYCADSAYGPFWSVSRYDDIVAVELDHETYSSDWTMGGIQLRDQPVELRTASFIRMDPPQHTEQRRSVAPIVAPSNLRNMEGMIRERTAFVLDGLPRGETFDWVDRVSIELTTMMLATLFDFPWQDRRLLTYWSDVGVSDIRGPDALIRSEEERREKLEEMGAYFRELFDARSKAEPTFDLISMLAHNPATSDMPKHEFIGNVILLIVGGNDTTRNSMSGGLLALHENPDEAAKLRADPGLVDSLVPEIIRYQTPVIHMRRTAKRDAELGGQRIAAGDKVVMWYVSGNFDEQAIEDADRFVIDRAKPRRHLAFGAGIHRCVGDRLAELQLKILWEEVLDRGLEVEVMDEPSRLYSNFIRGIRSLPVRIRA